MYLSIILNTTIFRIVFRGNSFPGSAVKEVPKGVVLYTNAYKAIKKYIIA